MRKLVFSVLLIALVFPLWAQQSTKSLIPFDPSVSKGKLANGLTYYVKSNATPKNRAELTLVVAAGSVQEDDDQQGLAHFCEHMSFNGTKNFPKNSLIKYFESIGMEFGPEINAYTSFDETVYMLKVPLDNEEYLQKGLQVLYDWACQVDDSNDEIEKERGVIHEEWRGGQGAQQRMMNQWLPVFLKDSKYAQRLPIGKMEVVDKCNPEAVRRFRKDWYRPDLEAVIVVGDFDQAKVVETIKSKFAAIPSSKNPRVKEQIKIPPHAQTLCKVVTDAEATYNSATLYIKHPMELDLTISGYRKSILNNLYNQMINFRLSELTQQENPPFVVGRSGYGGLIGPTDVFSSMVISHPGKIADGLEAVLKENQRVKQFGFTQTELERAKSAQLKSIENAFNERSKRESRDIADELSRNFLLRKEPVPGIELEYAYHKQFLPGITLAEVNALTKKWLTDQNRVLIVTAPQKEGVPVPTETEISSILAKVEKELLAAYKDEATKEPLMKESPKPGKIVGQKMLPEVQAEEWTLSNGSKVVFKQTDFKDDEILFTSFSTGGNSLVSDKDFVSGSIASTIMDASGIADFKLTTLQKMLAGKDVSVTPFIRMLTQGFEGGSDKSDLETMFQMIHLYFTKPRFDETAFSSYISKMNSQLDNKEVSPESAFADTFRVVSNNYHPRVKPMSKELLKQANFETIRQIATKRFSNPGAFTYIFVGNLDKNILKGYVEKYLASLPGTAEPEKWVDLKIRKPDGVVERTVYKGKDQKSIQYLLFHGAFEYATQPIVELDAISKILSTRLLESIREDKSSVYSIGAQPGFNKLPISDYEMTIYYGTSPQKIGELREAVFSIIRDLQTNGPSNEEVQKAIEKIKRERETNLRENAFWESILKSYYLNDQGDFSSFPQYDAAVKTLSVESLKKAANRIFDFKNYISVVLMPEK